MNNFPLTGGCNCGAVRFEVTAPLVVASYCHCKRCQRRSGAAASANAHPAPGAFRIVAGEDRLRVWQPEAAARNGSAATAARRCSAAIPATPIRSASGWGRSTPIRASGRASASSWPTPRPGSRYPTTDCPATPRAATRGVEARAPRARFMRAASPGAQLARAVNDTRAVGGTDARRSERRALRCGAGWARASPGRRPVSAAVGSASGRGAATLGGPPGVAVLTG